MQELDCRGLACPQPVLNVKDALEGMTQGRLTVIVDNEAAVGNVTRFAQSQGATVEAAGGDGLYTLTVTKGSAAAEPPQTPADVPAAGSAPGKPRLVVRIADSVMGSGSDELGRILMKAFISSLKDASIKPAAMVFYNGGVKLTVNGSEHLPALQALADSGVEIFSCGTCLDFFNIKDQVAVGAITNMFEIIETLSGADRVVSP